MGLREMATIAGKWSGNKRRPAGHVGGPGATTAADLATGASREQGREGKPHQCGADCPMMKVLKAKGLL